MSTTSNPEAGSGETDESQSSVYSDLKETMPPRTAKVSEAETDKLSVDQQVEARMRLAKAHMDDEIGKTKESKKPHKKLFARSEGSEVGVGDRVGYKQPERKPKSRIGGIASSAVDWLFGSKKS